MKITSVNNDLIKEVAKLQQRKFRDKSGLFLLEGEKCIEEALAYGVEIQHLFVTEGYEKFSGIDRIEVSDSVLSKISTTTSAPKCVAVGKQIKNSWDKSFKKIVLLENIKDAGNLGTILRTSCAFNVDAVILYGDTVDFYNPKCIRASVGNMWKIPIFNINDFNELKNLTKDFVPIATLPKNNNSIWLNDFSSKEKLLIMFGAESTGLSEELINYAEKFGKFLSIKMNSKVESLNLSISAGVVLYKLFETDKT